MDDRRERRVDERFYCINIDKLPGKIKIKGKNSHRKSTFNPDAAQKSLRDQGIFIYEDNHWYCIRISLYILVILYQQSY